MSLAGKKGGLQLGSQGRTLACQLAEKWTQGDADQASVMFRGHIFRAALQVILVRFYPEYDSCTLNLGAKGRRLRKSAAAKSQSFIGQEGLGAKGEKETEEAEFLDYTLNMLDHANLPARLHEEEIKQVWAEVAPHTRLLAVFWTLRTTIAGALEAFLVLDRLMYMLEQSSSSNPKVHYDKGIFRPFFDLKKEANGFELMLVPIFDPTISPRNLAIVACRSGQDS
mmetsp:Transcript_17509/g.24199  ORF Transcript_17509/g.24199 Transcript_17509/m.24199 type:complete len:225 (-) Transcript_17509:116-790(-)